MKKQLLFYSLLCGLLIVPFKSIKADAVVNDQSTEGKDFWVTFLKADSYDDEDKPITLSLTISAQKACEVTISNPHSGYSKTISLDPGELKDDTLYTGTAKASAADADKVKCYSIHSEVIDVTAVHVTSTENISLFASNWKTKSFDATNVLPTKALLDEYYIQSYPPSAHSGDMQQGTHFAIVASEDNTVVDYCPTVPTEAIRAAISKYAYSGGAGMTEEEIKMAQFKVGDTLTTPVLNKGEVFYVWTGTGGGDDFDLSGTHVKARNGKHIAVFQGAPHTNIPYQIRDRDHIFSQAMPVQCWGTTFAITSSMTRGRDKIRIMALNDETEVRVNGNLVHTFHFEGEDSERNDNVPSGAKVVQCVPRDKRTFEFEIGAKGVKCTDKDNKFDLDDPLVEGTSCFIETSCPVAVHLFMVSNTYDDTDKADPAMVWINPIEQVIEKITFATYNANNTHYFNVVTTKDNIGSMKIDDLPITGFEPVAESNDEYYFARQNIPHGTHTLEGDKGFIAHVYGYGTRESYGYSAGGATRVLTDIEIEGEEYTPGMVLCGDSVIDFACTVTSSVEKLKWNFGDGTPMVEGTPDKVSEISHKYEKTGDYEAYVLIYRTDDKGCGVIKGIDSIALNVRIERAEFEVTNVEVPCVSPGEQQRCFVHINNIGGVDLSGDNVEITFDEAAQRAHFDIATLEVHNDYLVFDVSSEANPDSIYGLHMVIETQCGTKKDNLEFKLPFSNDVIDQRYNNVLGLLAEPLEKYTVDDLQWYRNSDRTPIEGQVSAVLYLDDIAEGEIPDDSYYVCFTLNKGQNNALQTCACPKAFRTGDKPSFDNDPDHINITATYIVTGNKIFVNADWNGQTDVDCHAQWFDVSGHAVDNGRFDIPDGGRTIDVPATAGLYLLRVTTGKGSRSFKFVINK